MLCCNLYPKNDNFPNITMVWETRIIFLTSNYYDYSNSQDIESGKHTWWWWFIIYIYIISIFVSQVEFSTLLWVKALLILFFGSRLSRFGDSIWFHNCKACVGQFHIYRIFNQGRYENRFSPFAHLLIHILPKHSNNHSVSLRRQIEAHSSRVHMHLCSS